MANLKTVCNKKNKIENAKMQIMAKEIKDFLEKEDFDNKLDEVQRQRRIQSFTMLENQKT